MCIRDRPLLIAIQWREIGDFGWSDNYPTGMFTGVSRHPFQLTRHVDQRDVYKRQSVGLDAQPSPG